MEQRANSCPLLCPVPLSPLPLFRGPYTSISSLPMEYSGTSLAQHTALPDQTSACLSRPVSCCSLLNTNPPPLNRPPLPPWIHPALTHWEPLQGWFLTLAFCLASSPQFPKLQLMSSILGSLPARPPRCEHESQPRHSHRTNRFRVTAPTPLGCDGPYPGQYVGFLRPSLALFTSASLLQAALQTVDVCISTGGWLWGSTGELGAGPCRMGISALPESHL